MGHSKLAQSHLVRLMNHAAALLGEERLSTLVTVLYLPRRNSILTNQIEEVKSSQVMKLEAVKNSIIL